MKFLKKFKEKVDGMDNVSVGVSKPRIWYSSGNYALNKILSGSYFRCFPEGRITAFVGPSGSGKSFLSTNAIASAQRAGAHILALDSENALDEDFLTKLGVDVSDEKLTLINVDIIEDVNSIASDFFKDYEKEYGRRNYDAPPILILLDSLAMLSTSTEMDNYEGKGEIKGDQGQRSKRTKAMLRMILSKVKALPMTVVITDHVYPADPMAGDGVWAITNSTKFFPSIIGLVTRLKLREESEVVGVRMRVETYKSRFAKLGSKVELEVPYSTGMSPYSGLLELLETDGVVSKAGAWYTCELPNEQVKFQRKQLNEELVQKLLSHPIVQAQENGFTGEETLTEEDQQLQQEAESED